MITTMAIATLQWEQTPPALFRGGALSIGNFDGVHRGHVALVQELKKQAKAVGGPGVAFTFDPPPLQLLRPQELQPPLTTVRDRAALLAANGADHVLVLQTTSEFLRLSAEEFFQRVVLERLAAKVLVEGHNFGFGRNREGNVEKLDQLCRSSALGLVVVPPLVWNGTIVSSSRVRDALLRGDVREAADLLGRRFRIRGTVTTGRQRGKSIGFPTANLERIETLVPGDGVYAVRVHYQGKNWPGAANIGPNPTFGEHARKIEVHLIGFEGMLVGQVLSVEFLERLRETRPFASVEQLVEQLRKDVDQARRLATPAS
jgi:riboflavin kinase/FMN adenylyltransferase